MIQAAMDAYRIEKARQQVTLTLVGGDELRGHIFIPILPSGHDAEVDPAALFNDAEPFFPLELDGGDVLLVSKSRVVEVAGLPMREQDEVLRESAPMSLLQIVLAGGVAHFGSMRLDVRADRPRLLDLLNDSHDRFIPLYTDHGIRLVNRALIECVRPLD